jgi:glycine hydroxymethyltransferase
MSVDFIFRGTASNLDPELTDLIAREDLRQNEKIILVASESIAPAAVQELMGSSFANVYAEGYPRSSSRQQTTAEILDVDAELAYYRRYSDPRYYKGVEYADVLEALTRRRAAELFSANNLSPRDLYVNVQPLSGSPANSAVYSALLQPGDTIMGLSLIDGGHLTHGSKVSNSGKIYRSVPYRVDPNTEQLNYDAIESQALEERPNIIIAGFTAYPLKIDWARFREIADKCGAYLLADIAHISGLVAAGVHPSPVGIADVVTTTTHKSLCGPRGAMIITHRSDLVRKIDRAVFPGQQGGPHLNTIAALALALKLAKTDQFRKLQKRIVTNASYLAECLSSNGLRIVAGKTENHLLLIDTKSVTHRGVHLSGDMAARILDVAGIVTNSNTIPGDRSAFSATGVRIGTVWISQLGYNKPEVEQLANAITTVLQGCRPFAYVGRGSKKLLRAKVQREALHTGRMVVSQLSGQPSKLAKSNVVKIMGLNAVGFLNHALTNDVLGMIDGQSSPTHLYGPDLDISGTLVRESSDRFLLILDDERTAAETSEWLRDLSDGYVMFDDLYGKLSGPVVSIITDQDVTLKVESGKNGMFADNKPYFIGLRHRPKPNLKLPEFGWQTPADAELRRTHLYETHIQLGGRMVPFGGWDMPVWYSSVGEEHEAVRTTAGLFDVSHMGVLEASGPYATEFLNTVTTNDVSALAVGRSHYTYLLFPDGSVVDDLLIYRVERERFLLVVNASNNDKDWEWLNAVNNGNAQISSERPWMSVQHPAILKDLRDTRWGDECLVDIALQGPHSTDILLKLCKDAELSEQIHSLPWAGLARGRLAEFDVIISRTGYTGERTAYELFLHPGSTPEFWQILLDAGSACGIRPCGLASRNSTRTEAGLPLYGHELAGPFDLNPADAGFTSYVKLWKPFFIGRESFIAHESERKQTIVRFRMNEKGIRRPELGDPIIDRRGKVVGHVTSCAIDSDGYLLGQAIVPLDMAKIETMFGIYQLGGGKRSLTVPDDLKLGSRLPHPDTATVIRRFR